MKQQGQCTVGGPTLDNLSILAKNNKGCLLEEEPGKLFLYTPSRKKRSVKFSKMYFFNQVITDLHSIDTDVITSLYQQLKVVSFSFSQE